MSIAEDVETLGRATPGVHWGADEDGDPEPYLDGTVGDVLIWPEVDGYSAGYTVQVWGPPPLLELFAVTAPELGLLLRCVASGLTVELPCPDCATRGGPMEWHQATSQAAADGYTQLGEWEQGAAPFYRSVNNFLRHLARPCPTCSEPGPEVECDACDGPCPDCAEPGNEDCARCDGTADLGCAECSDGTRATGKRRPGVPTGRETVGLVAAWMRGRPTPCPDCEQPDESCFEDGVMCSACGAAGSLPGDPSTRAALGVLADKRQSEGDPLGELLALDLAGAACPGPCAGTGKIGRHGDRVYPVAADLETKAAHPCRDCEGHGTALAQRQRAIGTAAHPAASLTAAASA